MLPSRSQAGPSMPSVKEPSGVKGSAWNRAGSAAAIERQQSAMVRRVGMVMAGHCRIEVSAASIHPSKIGEKRGRFSSKDERGWAGEPCGGLLDEIDETLDE